MAMDFSSAQSRHQYQKMSSETLESMFISRISHQEKKPRPSSDEQSPKCPRCDSANTKFCYYNNYSLSQPRYFCKSCRRYWTKGGTLRNIPVGGGCRKNRRSSSTSSSKRIQDHQPMATPTPCVNITTNVPSFIIPNLSYDGSDDLGLAFSSKQTNGQLGLDDHDVRGFPVPVANPDMPFTDFFQNMYYGMGDGISLGLGINGGINGLINQEMGFVGFNGETTSSTAIMTMKQDMFSNNNNNIGIRDEGEQIREGLWGFPLWESDITIGGDGNMAGDVDSGRHGSWNGTGSSNWLGLLNNPLM